jgi:hypothetical protein
MKVDGGCHCGAIRYAAEIEPEHVVICHCTDCQTLSGSAFRVVARTREGTFRLTAGAPRIYVKTGESGTRRQQSFCPDCGSPIYSTGVGEGQQKVHSIRVGTIRQRAELIPKAQVWHRSAQQWVGDIAPLPASEKQT